MKIDKNRIIDAVIIFVTCTIGLLLTLIFSVPIERVLYLKPNMAEVNKSKMEVHFVDVGQGDCTLIRFADGKTMIVDSGAPEQEKDLLNYIDNVFFRNSENKTFDFGMLTHSDSDHCGNFVAVIEEFGINCFYRPSIYINGLESYMKENVAYDNNQSHINLVSKLHQLKNEYKINVKFSHMDTYVTLDNTKYMHILAPVKEVYSNTNEYSPIVVFGYEDVKFMLTGDATKANELEVMNNFDAEVLDVDILKLGHHGSKTSTSLEFLEATSPKYAIISVGADNNYNLPSSETLNNIAQYNQNNGQAQDVVVKQTQYDGNIICCVDANQSVNFLEIDNVDNFIFVPWYAIVIGLIVVLALTLFVPFLIKWLSKGNNK